jgi:hypothetical protein
VQLCSQPCPLFPQLSPLASALLLCTYLSLLTIILVSPDTSIAIAFGILSTVISLLGVGLGYLTLRAIAFENRMYSSPSLTSLRSPLFPSYSCHILEADYRIEGLGPRDLEYRPIQRHERTLIVTSVDRRVLENEPIIWQD